MGQGDREVLVPGGVLRVRDDARASHGGSGKADCYIRVAGDYLPMRPVLTHRLGARCAARAERDETSAKVLGDHIHIRQASRPDDFQI